MVPGHHRHYPPTNNRPSPIEGHHLLPRYQTTKEVKNKLPSILGPRLEAGSRPIFEVYHHNNKEYSNYVGSISNFSNSRRKRSWCLRNYKGILGKAPPNLIPSPLYKSTCEDPYLWGKRLVRSYNMSSRSDKRVRRNKSDYSLNRHEITPSNYHQFEKMKYKNKVEMSSHILIAGTDSGKIIKNHSDLILPSIEKISSYNCSLDADWVLGIIDGNSLSANNCVDWNKKSLAFTPWMTPKKIQSRATDTLKEDNEYMIRDPSTNFVIWEPNISRKRKKAKLQEYLDDQGTTYTGNDFISSTENIENMENMESLTRDLLFVVAFFNFVGVDSSNLKKRKLNSLAFVPGTTMNSEQIEARGLKRMTNLDPPSKKAKLQECMDVQRMNYIRGALEDSSNNSGLG